MIFKQLELDEFIEILTNCEYNNFSVEGAKLIYKWVRENFKMYDIESILTEFTEFENFEALKLEYPQIRSIVDLKEHTIVCEGSDLVIVADF